MTDEKDKKNADIKTDIHRLYHKRENFYEKLFSSYS